MSTKPEDGCFVYGMYIEGARWNYDTMELDESENKKLFAKCPTLWLKPFRQDVIEDFPCYDCPIYKTTERRGIYCDVITMYNIVI